MAFGEAEAVLSAAGMDYGVSNERVPSGIPELDEMLHHMIPSARGSFLQASSNIASAKGQVARLVLHPPEFLERERAFRKFDRALDWERRHIARLLRASG